MPTYRKNVPDKIQLTISIAMFISKPDSFGVIINGISTLFDDSVTDVFDFDFDPNTVTLTIPDYFVPYVKLCEP